MGIIDHYLKSEIEKAINEFGDMVYRLVFRIARISQMQMMFFRKCF